MTTGARAWWAAAILAIGVAAGASPLAAQEPRLDQQAVEAAPHDEALRLLGNALSDSVAATQSDPTIPEILAALDRNIAATRRIREIAAGSEALSEEQMRSIGQEVNEIARSFREIADMAPGVFQRRWQELLTLESIGDEAGFRIADARTRLAELARDNERIDRRQNDQRASRSEIEKDRLTRQANDAEIHSLEAAIAAWRFFAERHGEVMARMGDQSDDLDVFFHALRENARVYESAAQTLGLANSLNGALGDLESVQNLDAMRAELVQSWGDLMKIVDEVNDGLILQPGM